MAMQPQDKALLQACAAIDASTWSDALDQLGIEGVMQGLTKRSGAASMAGFAVTARQIPGKLGEFEKGEFAVGRIVQASGPGKVLVIDVAGAPISTLGGLAALACSQQNAEGVIIDGACRDVAEIQAIGLWLASRHVAPTTGKGRLRLQPLGCPVTAGGVRVNAGDLIVGDDTGIVVVPRARLQEVLKIAQKIVEVDGALEKRLRAGDSFIVASNATGYMPQLEEQA